MDEVALVVSVKQACKMLCCSRPKLYRLIDAGEIKSFRDGGLRKVEVQSIKDYIARKIAAEQGVGRGVGNQLAHRNI